MTSQFDSAALYEIISTANPAARNLFIEHFDPQLHQIATRLAETHTRFQAINDRVPQDTRSGWTQAYLYAAFDCLVTAVQLLVHGHLLPSGGVMRSWGEAVAMSLLLSNDNLDTFDRFQAAPTKFSVQTAIDYLGRKNAAKHLDVDRAGLAQFKKIQSFYSEHSHSSAWSLSTRKLYDRDAASSLAGEFDKEKVEYYQRELGLISSACDRLLELLPVVERHLAHRKNAS